MGKTDILIGKKATWGSDDDESEDDRPRRRTEAGEFSESGEDEAPPPKQTYVPPHLRQRSASSDTEGQKLAVLNPKEPSEEPPKEEPTEKPAAWSSLVKDGATPVKELEKKEEKKKELVVEKADDARVFRRLAKGEGKLSGLFGRKRELRQLKAQPPLAELAVDAAQAADAALAAREALQEEEEASITTESTEDNSPLALAAAAALANAGDRPPTPVDDTPPQKRKPRKWDQHDDRRGGKVDRKGSTRREVRDRLSGKVEKRSTVDDGERWGHDKAPSSGGFRVIAPAGGFRVLAPPPASPPRKPEIDLTRSRKAPPQKKPFPKRENHGDRTDRTDRPRKASNGIVVDVVSGRTEKGPPAGYVCKKCGVPGHFLKQCPQFEQRAPRAPKGPPEGYVCHKCGVSGHWIKDCPQAAVRSPAPAAPSLRRAKVSEESRRAASARTFVANRPRTASWSSKPLNAAAAARDVSGAPVYEPSAGYGVLQPEEPLFVPPMPARPEYAVAAPPEHSYAAARSALYGA